MRVDADNPEDRIYEVLLDGERLDRCVYADDEKGCAEVAVEQSYLKPDGSLGWTIIPDSTCERGFITKMRWGKVTIRKMERASDASGAADGGGAHGASHGEKTTELRA
jgi:hypothetical protein